jgi:hypothetical protein
VTLAPAHRAKTLAHELAHALLHEDSDAECGLKELEAESVAFVVCDVLGIQAGDWTFGYIAGWAARGDAALAAIKAAGRASSGRPSASCRPLNRGMTLTMSGWQRQFLRPMSQGRHPVRVRGPDAVAWAEDPEARLTACFSRS